MSDEETRDRLAAALETALDEAYHYSSYRWPQQGDCPRIADALLPVVRKLAAEELRAAADLIDRGPTFPMPPSIFSALIRERADDLDPNPVR